MKHKGALDDLETMIKGYGITITESEELEDGYQRPSFSRAIGTEFNHEVLNAYRNSPQTFNAIALINETPFQLYRTGD